MTIIYLLEVRSTAEQKQSVSSEHIEKLETCLKSLPLVSEIYQFTQAEGGHDPFLKDEHPPLLVFQLLFKDIESLEKSISTPEFDNLREQLQALPISNLRLLQEVLLFEAFLSSETRDDLASLSYLVNYQGPAEDETEFLQYYRDHHPAILLKFPNIRRVELGTPVECKGMQGIEHADRMLYCEVSFDNITLLNESLNSDMRKELRKDYDCFPPFTGEVTHFAMHRKVIL